MNDDPTSQWADWSVAQRGFAIATVLLMVLACVVLALVDPGSGGVGAAVAPSVGSPALVSPSDVAVEQSSAAVNTAPILAVLNRVRTEVGAVPLAVSACLTQAAGELANAFRGGAVPTAAPAACGPLRWGWVAGADPSGVAQANSAYGRTPSRPSPLIDKAARQVGLAVAPRRVAGATPGFVLVWAVPG